MDLAPGESVACEVPATTLRVGKKDKDAGTLVVTNQRVLWKGEKEQFSLLYTQIVLHALSSDTQAFARPCLYTQVKEGSLPASLSEQCLEAESEEDAAHVSSDAETAVMVKEDFDSMVEVMFLPEDASTLPKLFASMSDMAALHPDAGCADMEDDDDDDGFVDAETLRLQGWREAGEARSIEEERA